MGANCFLAMKFSQLSAFQQCLVQDVYVVFFICIAIALWAGWLDETLALLLMATITSPLHSWKKELLKEPHKRLNPGQRRFEFMIHGVLMLAIAVLLAWVIPFKLDTAAFWSFYFLGLVVLGALLYYDHYYLFQAS